MSEYERKKSVAVEEAIFDWRSTHVLFDDSEDRSMLLN